jgi:hypothetical protein
MPAITEPPVTAKEKTTWVKPEPSVEAETPLNRR